MAELAGVVEGEIVQDGPASELAETEALWEIPRRVKEEILKVVGVQEIAGKQYAGSTLTAACHHAAADPERVREAAALALRSDRTNPNRNFAISLYKALAEREDFLARKGADLAEAKKDAAFFKVMLERQHEDWKPAPKGGGTTVNTNITIVDKLQLAQNLRANPSLPTGD